MQISPFASTRSFFKTGKFRSRKQKTPQDPTASSYTTRNTSIDSTRTKSSLWRSVSRQGSIPNKQSHTRGIPQQSDLVSQQARKSNDTMRDPVKVIPPFQALPTTRTVSPALLDEDEYRALGLFNPESQRVQICLNSSRAASPGQLESENRFELDVPIQIARERRPDLQVTIPIHTPPSRSPRLLSTNYVGPTPPSAMSTPSSIPTGRHLKSATTATPRSIVSPLTGLEMPRPHRPFSTDSLEGTPTNKNQPPSRSDVRQQPMQRSRRPSTSSEVEAKTPRPSDTPVIPNGASVRFDTTHSRYMSPVPGSGRSRNQTPVNLYPPTKQHPIMHRKGSAVSIASQINVNKPLPPEPPVGSAQHIASSSPPKHIAYTTSHNSTTQLQLSSRSPSTVKLTTKTPRLKSEPPSPESQRPAIGTRRGSQSSPAISTTLRSKYTPKDLDSMDEAFQRRIAMSSVQQTPTPSKSRASPEQSQLSFADANYLRTIAENPPPSPFHSLPAIDEPLQISRGPMRMEPSRQPPQPPQAQSSRVRTIDIGKGGKKQMAISRTKSNTSVRTTNTVIESRPKLSTTEPVKIERRTNERPNNLSKADRILGLGSASAVTRQIFDPRPSAHDLSNNPGALLDDSEDEDFYEVRGKQDAHFEEIQDRLRLLSAKEDPAAIFDAFHEENAERPAQWEEEVREEKKKTEIKPTIEEKLHLTGTLQDNPIVPTSIAELEAYRTPSPVELQGSHAPNPILNIVTEEDSGEDDGMAELGLPSPESLLIAPAPPASTEQTTRRGRVTAPPPLSTASGTSKSLRSAQSIRVQSLASIAASDIPDFYANGPRSDSQSKRPSTAGSEYDELLTTQAAERVLLHILQSLDNLEDLFAAARVSKGFYRTFKRHELYLLKHAIWKMSPAAWELREMSIPYSELPAGSKDYTPALYFTYYVQDLLTMVELKAMILESCKSFLRPETISGLTGETEKSPLIDDAFWRVWTFCRLFGCGNKREDDIVGQMDWLRGGVIARQSSDTRTLALTDELARNSVLFNPPIGFAKGNNGTRGLTAEQLYDMIEIWTCLGVLVRGYHGKRQEARDYGIYDHCKIDVGDVVSENAMLGKSGCFELCSLTYDFVEEWTNHLLTLAPATVLDVTSPATPTRTQFAQARSQGYTKWVPPRQGMSRSTFLKEAVSRVYEETMAQRRPAQTSTTSAFSTLVSAHSSAGAADAAIAAKARIQRHQAEIRKQKEDPEYKNIPVSDDRPLSNYSDVLDRLEAISAAVTDAPPMPKLPGLAARLSRAKSKGNAATTIENTPAVRPNSPTSTIQSSVPSMQNSLTLGQENLSTADVQASSGKLKNKIKHPFQMKKNDTNTLPISPSKAGVGRFASIRNHKLLDKTKSKKDKIKQSESSESLPRAPAIIPSDEKFAVLPEEEGSQGGFYFPPQVRNPIDPAVETLVGMGYGIESARKALVQTATGNVTNFDAALSRLKKDRERRKRLERLDTMG